MRRHIYRTLARAADLLREVFDRLHGWALRRQTEENLRQLKLDYRTRKGWWR